MDEGGIDSRKDYVKKKLVRRAFIRVFVYFCHFDKEENNGKLETSVNNS
jgi:hypothetical protein